MITKKSQELRRKINNLEHQRKTETKKITAKFAKIVGVGLIAGSLFFGVYDKREDIGDFCQTVWNNSEGLYESTVSSISSIFSEKEQEESVSTGLREEFQEPDRSGEDNLEKPDVTVKRNFSSLDNLLDDIAVNNRGLLDEVYLRIRGKEDVSYMLHDIDHFSLMRIDEFVNDYEKTVKGVYMSEIEYMLDGVSREAKIFNLYGDLENDPSDDNVFLKSCYLNHDRGLYSSVYKQGYSDDGVFVLGNSDRDIISDHSPITVLNTDYLSNDEFYSELLDSQKDGQKFLYSSFASGNALLFSIHQEDNLYVDMDDEAFVLSR